MRISFLLLLFFPLITFSQIDTKKVFYLDTNYVEMHTEMYFIGCQEKEIDTTYLLKYDLRTKGNWDVYFDSNYETLYSKYYTKNDTLFSIFFHKNGKKKKEERELNNYLWIYSGKWCENGTIIFEGNPNNTNYRKETGYYCNGNKEWEAFLWNGRCWGVRKTWFENGAIKSEELYTEFNTNFIDSHTFKNSLISSKYFDDKGNIIKTNPYERIRSFPDSYKYIGNEELNGMTPFYNIMNHKFYDKSMTLFREYVYKEIQLKAKSICNFGFIDVVFVIKKDGTITNISIEESIDTTINQNIIEAIERIENWQIGIFENKPIDVLVKVRLELERINQKVNSE